MGLVRVGERMKRARKRMAVAERVARSERRRRVPSMVVGGFAVLAVSGAGLGRWCCLPQGGREKWYEAEGGRRGIGCVRKATLVS